LSRRRIWSFSIYSFGAISRYGINSKSVIVADLRF
jgi:hypothetical protein